MIDPKAESYDRFSPYNYTLNNPINLIDPDGTSVEDGPHYLASTYVGRDGKIIKHINDGDRNIYFVPDASKWNGDKQNLSIIGREREGVNYNQYVGRSLSQTPFDRTKVLLRGENQKEQLSSVVGVLSRFGPQGISQSFALDGLLSPHLSAYFAISNILELIGDSDIESLSAAMVMSKGGKRNIWPDEYGYPPNVRDVDWKLSDSQLADKISKDNDDTRKGQGSSNGLAKKWFRDKRPK